MTTKKTIGIGLLGLGTVGTGVWKLLEQNGDLLKERAGVSLEIKRVCVRDPKKKREIQVPENLISINPDDILNDPGVDIVVELMGGIEPAGKILIEAIRRGKHVVTANKALIADRGEKLFKAAREKGVSFGFEASVAGGIPIIKAIREGFIANRIQEIYGIINGTANFILTEMADRGGDFSTVLKQAQKEGFAEQDPSFDVKGIDASQKLSILISLCYGVTPPREGMYVEGIDRVTGLDIEFARKLGYVIKLLAISKDHAGAVEARVHPTMVPLHHPLADVKGVFNAIYLKGDAVGETMFFGRGAGMMPTASAVVSDIAQIAQEVSRGYAAPAVLPVMKTPTIQPIEELVTPYYFRFSVVDRPGVLAQIAKHLGDHDISIANVYQQERDAGAKVPIVVMTHDAHERNVRQSVEKIDKLESVLDRTMVIRVERFGK